MITYEQDVEAVKKALDNVDATQVHYAAQTIINCIEAGGKVLIAGNGGSAADAQHFAGEMVGWYLKKPRKALPAIALTTDTSVLTAIMNDEGEASIFSRQVEALGKYGDVFIGISTSGKSENINQALRTANEKGLVTVGLCGSYPMDYTDIQIRVGGWMLTPFTQAAHITILHCICGIVDEAFYEAP